MSRSTSTGGSAAGAGLLFVRHGATHWNLEGRIQGRTDVALSRRGRAAVCGLSLPAPFDTAPCYSSPLTRSLETARLISGADPLTVDELVEMDWGRWEGRTLAGLRAELGDAMGENEAKGLDFRPQGGESPRQVMARLERWLVGLHEPVTASVFTHKGVIRAMLALATGWDMIDDFPQRIDWGRGQAFSIGGGRVRLERLNVPLPARGGKKRVC